MNALVSFVTGVFVDQEQETERRRLELLTVNERTTEFEKAAGELSKQAWVVFIVDKDTWQKNVGWYPAKSGERLILMDPKHLNAYLRKNLYTDEIIRNHRTRFIDAKANVPENYEQLISRSVNKDKLLVFVQGGEFNSYTNFDDDERSKTEWIEKPLVFAISTTEQMNKTKQPYAEFPLSFNFYDATVNLPAETRVSDTYDHVKKTTITK